MISNIHSSFQMFRSNVSIEEIQQSKQPSTIRVNVHVRSICISNDFLRRYEKKVESAIRINKLVKFPRWIFFSVLFDDRSLMFRLKRFPFENIVCN